MGALEGQVAVITGAGRGMGAAIASAFAGAGARVGLIARTASDLQAVAGAIAEAGGVAEPAVADVTQRAQVQAAVARLRAALGPVDILVNSAGVATTNTVVEMPEADWDRQFDTNVKAVMLCSQAVLPDMIARRRGLIINIGSMAGLVPGGPGGTAYVASKWALVGLSRCLSLELKPHNIRVTLLNPGTTDTPFRPDEFGKHPEWMQASDVAEAALFVATMREPVSIHELAFSVTRDGWG
ncbi:MAG: 3-ketoacyl-ACP reductase [Anaerolineae bacterium]